MTTRRSLQADLADQLGSEVEARWMVDEVLGRAGRPSADVDEGAAAAVAAMAARRLAGEPLQYVLGSWSFRHLDLLVDRRALIPRPETEQVVEVAIAELLREPPACPVVVDLGTGTGAIALSLAAELGARFDRLVVWATDAAVDALALAATNRQRLGTTSPGSAERVRLRVGSWYEALPGALAGHVDLVVSNPPYVSEEEWAGLDAQVRLEPYGALVAGPGGDGTPGLAGVEAVIGGAPPWLAPGGAVVVELAPHQAVAALAMCRRLGYRHARVLPDLAGRPRALVARR